MKKLLILLSALALTLTVATAEGKCGEGKKTEKKCDSGKCDNGKQKNQKCDSGKCGEGKKEKKEAPSKGKCGQGKCG